MDPFKKGLLELLQQIILPVVIVFCVLLWLIGTSFLWAISLFCLGTFFLFQVLFFLHYYPAWLKWIMQLKSFRKPLQITYFAISFLLFIAALVWAISWTYSERFCIISFGAYVTINWIIYRIITANILLYARLLKSDHFKISYWFFTPIHRSKNLTHPNLLKRGIAIFIDGLFYYKNTSTTEYIKTINLLFKRKFYTSIIDLQYSFFRLFDWQELDLTLQKRILDSIHELQNILKVQNFKLQEKQMEQLRFFESLKKWQLKLISSPELLEYWFNLAFSSQEEPQKEIHFLLIQNLYNQIGTELSKLIADPKDYLLDTNAKEILKNQEIIHTTNTILKKIPFPENSSMGNSIRYTYSLIFITNGILNN